MQNAKLIQYVTLVGFPDADYALFSACSCGRWLSSVKRRYEHDVIAFLNLVLVFALQFPVCFVDENQYSRSPEAYVSMQSFAESRNIHRVVQDEKFFPWILHDLVAKMSYEECNICCLSRLVFGR
jgi:hypothetical protein